MRAGRIDFKNVNFGYGRDAGVLQNFNLTIHPGEKIGLVGRSGAGKSTVVNLLLRFFHLEGGAILIDGEDISGLTQESLRAQISVVTQDTSLLHRSIRENIRYGRPAGERGRDPARRASSRTRTTSSSIWKIGTAGAATTPMSASAASSCPAASASASPSRASFSKTRRSWYSTRRPRRSTAKSKPRSSRASAR